MAKQGRREWQTALGDADRPRPSIAELMRALDALSDDAARIASWPARPRASRRSLTEIDAELERLSTEVSVPVVCAQPRRGVPGEAAEDASVARPVMLVAEPSTRTSLRATVPPAAIDFTDLPAVLGLLGEDGSVRNVLTPPPPPSMDMEIGTRVGDLVEPPRLASEPPALMREPTPVPIAPGVEDLAVLDEEFAAIPQPPPMPGADVQRSVLRGPDLPDIDLDAMFEPPAEASGLRAESPDADAELGRVEGSSAQAAHPAAHSSGASCVDLSLHDKLLRR